jgi:hypothetical protein
MPPLYYKLQNINTSQKELVPSTTLWGILGWFGIGANVDSSDEAIKKIEINQDWGRIEKKNPNFPINISQDKDTKIFTATIPVLTEVNRWNGGSKTRKEWSKYKRRNIMLKTRDKNGLRRLKVNPLFGIKNKNK